MSRGRRDPPVVVTRAQQEPADHSLAALVVAVQQVDHDRVAGLDGVADMREVASRQAISIHAALDPALPTTIGDRIQLQQVLMNLMLNAIEAMTDAKGELNIRSQRTDDGQILISVSDSGSGLPVQEPERIFDAFFTTKARGTGMGLSISRRIIESHGGRLWASANSPRGAVFQFTLPGSERELTTPLQSVQGT